MFSSSFLFVCLAVSGALIGNLRADDVDDDHRPEVVQQVLSCKCGGEYGNGRAVTGCDNDRCLADSAKNVRCATIFSGDTPIGYDCIDWSNVKEPCPIGENNTRICLIPEIFSVQRFSIGKTVESVKNLLSKQIPSSLTIPPISIRQYGIELTIENYTVAEFNLPKPSYTMEAPSSVRMVAKGAEIRLCANWEARVLFKVGGTVCAGVGRKAETHTEFAVNAVTSPKGKITLDATCRFYVPFHATFGGFGSSLLNVFTFKLEKILAEQVDNLVCIIAKTTVKTTFGAMVTALPTDAVINTFNKVMGMLG